MMFRIIVGITVNCRPVSRVNIFNIKRRDLVSDIARVAVDCWSIGCVYKDYFCILNFPSGYRVRSIAYILDISPVVIDQGACDICRFGLEVCSVQSTYR